MIKFGTKPYGLRLNLQMFADTGGGEGGGAGGGGEGSEGAGGSGGGEKTFTQADLDQHVQSRLPRAEKAAQKALAKELGYDSVEAMKEALKKPEGGKGGAGGEGKPDPADIEKLLEDKMKEREKANNEKTFNRLLNAEVKVLANELGFADWEDARKLADLDQVKENDKGELEGVKEALEELLKKKPHLGKQKPGGAFGAQVGGGSGESKKDRMERMKKLAQGEGTSAPAANDPWKR
ncbi:hypothetical protein [Paenibacillus daejeonensis]|uniref:hypothetical protein n=1 Tax=Paenibacillus daejeonensis TaxID=135193 RepID=UPI0003752B20|nr:hypothetical protein [Paenibacillus daejeonensis]